MLRFSLLPFIKNDLSITFQEGRTFQFLSVTKHDRVSTPISLGLFYLKVVLLIRSVNHLLKLQKLRTSQTRKLKSAYHRLTSRNGKLVLERVLLFRLVDLLPLDSRVPVDSRFRQKSS